MLPGRKVVAIWQLSHRSQTGLLSLIVGLAPFLNVYEIYLKPHLNVQTLHSTAYYLVYFQPHLILASLDNKENNQLSLVKRVNENTPPH